MAANRINVTAKLKFPSIENLIELIPKQTPAKVKILKQVSSFLMQLF